MKFSIGYQYVDNNSLIEVIAKYRNVIGEVYFSWGDFAESGAREDFWERRRFRDGKKAGADTSGVRPGLRSGEGDYAARTASKSASISLEGALVSRETTTMHRQEKRNAGSSS